MQHLIHVYSVLLCIFSALNTTVNPCEIMFIFLIYLYISSAGRLSTAALLDADVASPVTYVVEARVCDTSGTCNHDNLTLTITEGNDPPVFTPSVVSLTLPEDTVRGRGGGRGESYLFV